MNIEDLTIAQVQQIFTMFHALPAPSAPQSIAGSAVNKYVIVRSRNEGINAGFVDAADETGVILRDARRLWYHRPANTSESWYEGVANHGLSQNSKVSAPVSQKIIVEDYSITLCTDKAMKSIVGARSYEQS